MSILFISDLHLEDSHLYLTRLFANFLQQEAPKAEAVYILCDLFEVWLGDDDNRPEVRQYLHLLKQLTDTGVPVYVLRGNRDFLIGDEFAAETGCRLLEQNSIVDLYGTPTLICHGDSLCTDDVDHQRFRDMVLQDAWQKQFLSKPLAERILIARNLRDKSREETRKKPEAITDVNQTSIENLMRERGVRQMIHGHTHRPAIHHFEIDGKQATRIVLGDWDEIGNLLRVDANGCRLEDFTLQSDTAPQPA